MHKKSSKMQFSFATGLWRLRSFIVRISLNCSFFSLNNYLTLRILYKSAVPLWKRFRTSGPEVFDQSDTNHSSRIQLQGPNIQNWTKITLVNLTTYRHIFYFHKTADKVTVYKWYYWWEKIYFCQIHILFQMKWNFLIQSKCFIVFLMQ